MIVFPGVVRHYPVFYPDGRFEDLRYEENDEEFFEVFYKSRPYELAWAISYGEYNFMDLDVKIHDYGNIESVREYELETMIDTGSTNFAKPL